MSELKLTADSGGGTVSLKGPATTTGNADVPFVLPVADGSAGQYLKTDGSKNLSFATVAGGDTNTPGFQAYTSGGISVSHSTFTEMVIATELWDSASAYDTSTGRFTPQTAGTYFAYYQFFPVVGSDSVNIIGSIRKNGSTAYNTGYVNQDILYDSSDHDTCLNINGIFTLNGSSDYISAYAYMHNYSGSSSRDMHVNHFGAFRITAAF